MSDNGMNEEPMDEQNNQDQSNPGNEGPINFGPNDNIDPENMGEFLLKNAALTMTSKGISNDLKEVIKMKVDYVNKIFSETIKLTDSVTKCPDKRITRAAFSHEGVLTQVLDHVLAEVFVTNIALNNILVNFITKEKNIREEQKILIESDIEKMIDREMKKFKRD
jgi:hypothetical protein